MEVLAPIIIFGVLVLISFVRKMHEQQRLEELRRRAQSSPDLEELPEATRRVIFGSPAIPSSREKYAGEEGEDEGEDEERTEATPRRVVPIPVARPYQRASGPAMRPAPGLPPGEPTVDDALRQLLERRQQYERQQQALRETEERRRQAEARQREAAMRQRAAQQQRSEQPHRQPSRVQQRQDREGPPPAPPQPKRKPAGSTMPKPVFLRGLLHDAEDVRKGIILAEILGPPRALRQER